ncbi:MAG TPA: ABC transporter substrate-binding protein [Stellaceae bacterium]|jgi:ABC-type nitrate/sulfonate/bicarbonate transport system substrate-binding protein
MSKTRRHGPVLAALAAGLCVWMSGATSAAAEAITVGKADAASTSFLPVHVGDRVGIFKKHGLELKISDFTGGSKLSQAITAGAIDIGLGAGTEMALVAKGAPMMAVCDGLSPIPFIGIAVPYNSPVRTLDQLKGKKIGISSAGSLTDWLAKQINQHEGWGADGVTSVAIGNGAAAVIAAFRTNAIDADLSVTSNVFNWEEKKEGRLLVSASDFVGNIAASTTYASQHFIDSDPDGLRRFLAAWLETIDYLTTHKAETVKIESEVTGYSENVMTKEYDLTASKFSRDCKFDAESLANLKRAFVDQKLVDTPPDMTALYTEAFLPKAAR